MKIELMPGETLIKEGAANLQRGIETVGGRLYLTDQRLYFDTHFLNVARGPETIALSDILDVQPIWTKVYRKIPIAPNSLRVFTKSGQYFDFVVWGRMIWKKAIEEQARI